jgi:hypothetical protein
LKPSRDGDIRRVLRRQRLRVALAWALFLGFLATGTWLLFSNFEEFEPTDGTVDHFYQVNGEDGVRVWMAVSLGDGTKVQIPARQSDAVLERGETICVRRWRHKVFGSVLFRRGSDERCLSLAEGAPAETTTVGAP